MMGMSKDDAMITTLATGFDGFSEWPYGVGSPEGIEDQSFMPRHARLVLSMTGASPQNPNSVYTSVTPTVLQPHSMNGI